MVSKLLTAAVAAALSISCPARAEERPPAVAGQFYPARAVFILEHAKRMIDAAPSADVGSVVALLSPHAGWEFSGPAAARSFKLIKPGQFDTVMIIGTGHHKWVEGAALDGRAYGSPAWRAPHDEALGAALLKASPLISRDPEAHAREHSVEVLVPLLRARLGKFKLVAMVMNTAELDTARAVGLAVAKAVKASGKRVLIVASSDLSHYPNGDDAAKTDKTTLEALKTLDPAYFWLTNRLILNRGLKDLSVSYCGEGAVIAVMTAARALGAGEVKVVEYLNSGDVVSERDYGHVVGYAAAAFVKAKPPKAPSLELTGGEKADLLALARATLAERLAKGAVAEPAVSANPRYNLPAAVFVTLRTRTGELRGCVGSLSAQESLLESVAHNAVASALQDRRFRPVEAAELAALRVEISVLSSPRLVKDAGAIKPGDGVILENGQRSGVFLPEVWKSLPDKAAFLAELCSQKAGLPPECATDPASRFRVFSTDSFEE